MDPLTQGTLGALYVQALSGKKRKTAATAGVTVLGFLSGMAADLDILIQSDRDPLLYLEYHRQFTHSLFFVPFGALLIAWVAYFLFRKYLSFRQVYLYSFVGYLTHAPLDACTSYGTQLLWPITNFRFSWDLISIIDPLFTLPILTFVIVATVKGSKWARWGVLWSLLYLCIGFAQNQRAKHIALELAETRGHINVQPQVKPSFANLWLWKSIYRYENSYYVDAIRVGISTKVYFGDQIQALDVARDFPWLQKEDVQAQDIERFRWFSQGYIAVHPKDSAVIGDIRYSLVPNEIEPLWGIRLDPMRKGLHTPFESLRSLSRAKREKFIDMLLGK